MTLRARHLALMLASAAAAATPALSAPGAGNHVLIVAPVEIRDAPAAAHMGRVSCQLFRSDRRPMGDAIADFPLHEGRYSGRVRVEIRPGGYPLGVNPVPDARSASCRLSLLFRCSSSAPGGEGLCTTLAGVTVPPDSPAAGLFDAAPGAANVTSAETSFDPASATVVSRRLFPAP